MLQLSWFHLKPIYFGRRIVDVRVFTRHNVYVGDQEEAR